jgi:DNA-binding NarL/FixJ family response regulator
MKRIRILIVDDHAMVREAIARALSSQADLEVVGQAADGRDGVAAAVRLEPDVATLDVAMAGLNGLEAAGRIRRRVPATRVLMLTAHEEDLFIRRAVENGANGYLSKRAPVETLARAIREVARGRGVFPARMSARPSERATSDLTPREMEILQLVAEGHANKQAARQLGISIKTVEKHRQKVMDKLQIHETAGLTRYAIAAGLVEVPAPFPRRPVLTPPRRKAGG